MNNFLCTYYGNWFDKYENTKQTACTPPVVVVALHRVAESDSASSGACLCAYYASHARWSNSSAASSPSGSTRAPTLYKKASPLNSSFNQQGGIIRNNASLQTHLFSGIDTHNQHLTQYYCVAVEAAHENAQRH
jgi:hypothetical protein